MTKDEALKLAEILDYNPVTGVFTWKVKRGSKSAGATASYKNLQGYMGICIERKHMKAHRVAWLMTYGELPDGEIDHINGIRDDNRLCNLRLVNKSTNQQNQRKARKDSTSKLLGVSWHSASKKWRADIRVNGKKKHIGYFDCKDKAHQAYLNVKRQLHEGNTL